MSPTQECRGVSAARALVLAAWMVVVATGAGAGTPLARALEASLEVPALRGARVGALVVEAGSDRVLFQHSPERPLVPASNLKILTALAALETFGPTHRFTTRIYADASPTAGGEVDLLYLQGGGDPALTSESWWRLAADLRLAGLRRVRTGIVVDDSAFDRVRWHPSWGKVTSRAYYAPVGALNANYGAFAVEVRAGASAGQPLDVRLDPPVASLRLVNRGVTLPSRSRPSLKVDRVAGAGVEEIRVTGGLAAGSAPRRLYRSVADPARYAGAVARMQLEANGISVGPASQEGTVPETATELLAFEGRPLAEIVGLFVKNSNNGIAETLVKAMGASRGAGPGSWAQGTLTVQERLAGLGLDPRGLTLVDGSGLSKRNRVTPRALVTALRVARESFVLGPELMASLPIAARDGTLQKRAGGAEARVRAKTGLLERVTGLSGYAELADGRTAIFSLLVNGYRTSDAGAMDAVDGFVAALVNTVPATPEAGANEASRALWAP